MNGLFCKAHAPIIGGCWCILQSACWVVGGRGGGGGTQLGRTGGVFCKAHATTVVVLWCSTGVSCAGVTQSCKMLLSGLGIF